MVPQSFTCHDLYVMDKIHQATSRTKKTNENLLSDDAIDMCACSELESLISEKVSKGELAARHFLRSLLNFPALKQIIICSLAIFEHPPYQ